MRDGVIMRRLISDVRFLCLGSSATLDNWLVGGVIAVLTVMAVRVSERFLQLANCLQFQIFSKLWDRKFDF